MYRVEIHRSAERALAALWRGDRRAFDALNEAILALAADPHPPGSQKLRGSYALPLYRIRRGDYRVVYAVFDADERVIITRVAHRREVYRDLP